MPTFALALYLYCLPGPATQVQIGDRCDVKITASGFSTFPAHCRRAAWCMLGGGQFIPPMELSISRIDAERYEVRLLRQSTDKENARAD